jgi:hypothetical protein
MCSLNLYTLYIVFLGAHHANVCLQTVIRDVILAVYSMDVLFWKGTIKLVGSQSGYYEMITPNRIGGMTRLSKLLHKHKALRYLGDLACHCKTIICFEAS